MKYTWLQEVAGSYQAETWNPYVLSHISWLSEVAGKYLGY